MKQRAKLATNNTVNSFTPFQSVARYTYASPPVQQLKVNSNSVSIDKTCKKRNLS